MEQQAANHTCCITLQKITAYRSVVSRRRILLKASPPQRSYELVLLVSTIVSLMCLQTVLLVLAMQGVDDLGIWPDGEGIYNASLTLFLRIYSPCLLSPAFSLFSFKIHISSTLFLTLGSASAFYPKPWTNILFFFPKFFNCSKRRP